MDKGAEERLWKIYHVLEIAKLITTRMGLQGALLKPAPLWVDKATNRLRQRQQLKKKPILSDNA